MSARRSHRAVPPNGWPAMYREAWASATEAGDEISGLGIAATWAPRSRENAELAYGRFIGFLGRNGRLHPVARVGECLAAVDLCAFGGELAAQLAPVTVLGIFASLNMAVKAMDPAADRTVLKTIISRLSRTAKSTRDIASNLVTPQKLMAIAISMMDKAEQQTHRSWRRASLYRNGLLIMFMTLCPLRPGAIAEMQIGEHVLIGGDNVRVKLPPLERRKRRPEEVPIPPNLAHRLLRYISYFRPMFPRPRPEYVNALWLSRYGNPLDRHTISKRIQDRLQSRTGKNFTAHMFRHVCATHIVDVAPEQARMIVGALGHSGFRTAQRHYIKGQQRAAVEKYQHAVRHLTGRARSKRHRKV